MQDVWEADEELGWTQTEQATETIKTSDDEQEGVAAFLDKRSPVWLGR